MLLFCWTSVLFKIYFQSQTIEFVIVYFIRAGLNKKYLLKYCSFFILDEKLLCVVSHAVAS